MCGICGIYGAFYGPGDREKILKMMDAMSHRGPDGSGSLVAEDICLGHRRLSIIDLDGGAQPMSNEANDVWVVFNGEIYNYIELGKILVNNGHILKTKSDTEIIIHAYEEWGQNCVNHFNGMFAFAIYDKKRKLVLLARDHLGIKPLYYFVNDKEIHFASEIKSLLQSHSYTKEVDINSLAQLFTLRYVPSPKTMFKSIYKLPPGHTLTFTKKGVQVKKYWNWKPNITIYKNVYEAVEYYRYLLEDAIKLQLRSDVPLGLFLSSGVDSGAILAIMSKYMSSSIHTFTLGFVDGDVTNETEDAKKIASDFGTIHRELIIGPKDYGEYFQKYLLDIEEPVGNETAAAFYFVSRLASEEVKVALTGQGADEPWAGYRRYVGVRLSQYYCLLPQFIKKLMTQLVPLFSRREWLKRGVQSLNEKDLSKRFIKIYSFFSEDMRAQLFEETLKSELAAYQGVQGAISLLQKEVKDLDPLNQMLYIDTRANLPDDLLMVNDKTAMANSIETRVPFLDYRIVEFIESLPSSLKLNGLEGKYLHKKAVEKWLPINVIYKTKKGFSNPINNWLRTSLNGYIRNNLLSSDSQCAQIFDKKYIEKLIKLHTEKREENLRQIYLLISFELWHRTFFRV